MWAILHSLLAILAPLVAILHNFHIAARLNRISRLPHPLVQFYLFLLHSSATTSAQTITLRSNFKSLKDKTKSELVPNRKDSLHVRIDWSLLFFRARPVTGRLNLFTLVQSTIGRLPLGAASARGSPHSGIVTPAIAAKSALRA